MTSPASWLKRNPPKATYHDARNRAVAGVESGGFDVLAKIDIQAAMQESGVQTFPDTRTSVRATGTRRRCGGGRD
jgi:hypothetical protein